MSDVASALGIDLSALPDAGPPQYPFVEPHPSPDGRGLTNLSDEDYHKFTAGIPPPARSVGKPDVSAGVASALGVEGLTDFPVAPVERRGKGLAANVGAGTSDVVASTLGAPVDVVTGAANLGLRGFHAGAGVLNKIVGGQSPPPEAPQIHGAIGGSDFFRSAQGLIGADPRTVAPANRAERVARGVGEGAAGAVIPWAGARALPAMTGIPGAVQHAFGAGSAGAQAGIGAGSGGAGVVAEEAVPDPWKPLANFGGQVAGGAVAAATGAALGAGASAVRGAVRNQVAPFTRAGQERLARERVTAAITDMPEVRVTLGKPPAELVPGSEATPYQLTGDPGLGTLERGVSRDARYAPEFAELRADQNAARVASIEGQKPPADVSQIGSWFRQQLTDLTAAHEADITTATAAARGAVDRSGAVTTPHQAGGVVRQGVESTRAPEIAQSDAALAAAQRQAEDVTAGLGGSPDQTVQGHGARMRGAAPTEDAAGSGLEGVRKPARDAAGRLFDAIDPDGRLALDVSDVGRTARELMASLNTRMGGKLHPEEADVLPSAAALRGVELFSDLRELRTNVGAAMREIAEKPGRESPAYRRMTILQQSIDDAMVKAVDEPSVAARLQGEFDRGAGPVSGQRGAEGVEGQAAGGMDRSPVQGGEGVPRPGRVGYGEGDRDVAPVAADRGRQPESLIDFQIARGGVRDDGGDLRAGDLDRVHHRAGGRLINPNGESLDYAREAAVEAGFLPANADINAYRDALRSNAPVYRISEQADATTRAQRAREGRLTDEARFVAGANVEDAAATAGVRLSGRELDHATDLAMFGAHPDDAIQQAVRSTEEAALDTNAARNAVGSPGVPLAAQQAEMPIGGRSDLAPNFTAKDQDALRAANAAYKDYKETFRSGAVGDALASSSRNPNGYRLADSQVPTVLFNGGAKGAEAADSLIRAAGSREAALEILGDYPAFSLRSAAEEMGMLSVGRYERWLAKNKAALDKFPELRARFDTAAKARAALDDLRARRAEIDAAHPIAPGWDDAKIIQQLVVPGPRGFEAAGRVLEATRGSRDAQEAVKDYLAWSLRNAAEVKSGPMAGTIEKGAYDRWMKQFDSFLSHPDLAPVRSKFQNMGDAQSTLDQALARHVEARKAYETSVARHFLGDADPAESIGRILRSGNASGQMAELARLTASDPAARASIQAAVIEHMLRELKSNNPVSGNVSETYLKSNQLQNFIRDHVGADGEGALRHIMTPQQIDALNSVALDMRRSNLSISGNKVPGGSDTAENRSAMMMGHRQPSLVGTLAALEVAGDVAGHLGSAAIAATPGGAGLVGKVAGMVGLAVLKGMRDAGFAKVDDLVAAAVRHPDKMAALLADIPPNADPKMRAATAIAQIKALAAASAVRDAGRNEDRK